MIIMPRYIDAKQLEKQIKEAFETQNPVLMGQMLRWIRKQPTIDAVEVVRCRECKHLNVLNRKELYAHCPKTNTVFLPFELDTREHFCSLGERKEGADNDT